uniref:Uncharacterized protein n=1 Tax=Heterorhabditis bacteriophora TaxID=37862 RepID=A0A1I7WGD0_HETBA
MLSTRRTSFPKIRKTRKRTTKHFYDLSVHFLHTELVLCINVYTGAPAPIRPAQVQLLADEHSLTLNTCRDSSTLCAAVTTPTTLDGNRIIKSHVYCELVRQRCLGASKSAQIVQNLTERPSIGQKML